MNFALLRPRLVLLGSLAAGVVLVALRFVLANPKWANFVTATGAAMCAVTLFIFWFWRSSFGWSEFQPDEGETAGERDTRWTRFTIVVFTIAGLFALLLFSIAAAPSGHRWVDYLQFFGLTLLVACAFFSVGVLLGFLFAIPKSLSQSSPHKADQATGLPPPPTSATGAIFGVNSNLEEISDWLTKIIVGLGLVNLKMIPGLLGRLAHYFSFPYPPGTSESPTLATILFFSVDGFFLGYLMTRLYLQLAFTRAARASSVEEIAAKLREQAESSPDAGPGGDIEALITREAPVRRVIRTLAMGRRQPTGQNAIYDLAQEYDVLRVNLDPGIERTQQMESIAAGLRGYAPVAIRILPVLQNATSAGLRLAAISCLEVVPNSEYLEWIADRFKVEDQPFLQFHAASALLRAATQLPPEDLPKVREAIERVLALGAVRQDTDRYKVLQRAREELKRRGA